MCYQETFEVSCTSEAATRARHIVGARARAWLEVTKAQGLEDGVDLLVLLTSELVGNACRYGARPVHVDLELARGVAKVAVTDGAPGAPVVRSPGLWDESGRGMAIVDAVSEEWGVRWRRSGKQVWCRVRLSPANRCSCSQSFESSRESSGTAGRVGMDLSDRNAITREDVSH